MDSRTSTAEAKHSYRAEAWSPKQANATYGTQPQPQAPNSPPQEPQAAHQQQASPTVPFPANLDFLPLWLPQQSNIFQAQLLHYNTLISPTRGGGLQTAPLPPVVSSPNVQASPRSRTSSKASTRDGAAGKSTTQGGNGSRSRRNSEKARSAVTNKDTTAKMAPKQNPESAKNSTQRPPAMSSSPKNQSYASSVPNTPHQHARKFSFESRDPSPNDGGNHSPRSVYSETNSALPSLRPLPPRLGGCKFETAQINSRRRIPYSVGSDRLEKLDLRTVKNKLSGKDEDTLTKDMREIYNKLLPTDKIEKNRKALVDKLEEIFNDEWPGHDIRVHLFGSSGNLLCSDDSDVDICITTPWKELEGVCIIADLLAKRGMEKVVCISAAKVPIVKIWDPELGLACDMNVNNTIALENTRMVRTYVEADPRVRQLAMIIKYWTKRRIINDAAFGGTLSSYTWICLIVAFLQLRSPAVLPALHQLPYKTLKSDGTFSDFADNLKKIEGFGSKNKASEADLLFQFFRFYAHEFDYDKHVLSVRSGKLMSKVEKKWNYASNNQLCVEEPFNTSRNLGNTADEYSFRGLHLELRRAFDLISQAKLEEACEQFVFPKEEERVWSRPAPQPRPVLVRSSSQTHPGRGGRHNHRGGRHNNFRGGGNGSNRRASSAVPNYDANMFMHAVNMPQDMMWYQSPQFQFQYAQQDLMTQMAYHQESMRQFYAQSPAFVMHQNIGQQRLSTSSSSGQQSTDRSRTNSFDNAPAAAPLRPDLYAVYSMSLGHGFYPPSNTGYGTYPSSPVTAAGQDFRRPLQRSATASDAGMHGGSSSMRSQSQPASRTGSSATGRTHPGQRQGVPFLANRSANGVPIPSFISDEADFDETPKATSESSVSGDRKSQGFFAPRSSSPVKQIQSTTASDIAFGDLATRNATLDDTSKKPPTLAAVVRQSSRSPSPHRHDTTPSTGIVSAPLPSAPFNGTQARQSTRPLVVNGSGMKPAVPTESSYVAAVAGRSVPDDTQLSHMVNALCIQSPAVGQDPRPKDTGAATELTAPAKTSPVTPHAVASEEASFRDRIARMNGPYYATVAANRAETPNKDTKPPLSAQQKLLNRQKQGGIIAPLDLALGENPSAKQPSIDLAHLSPVYETRTPSPATHRKTAESAKGGSKDNYRDTGKPLQERSDLPKPERDRDGLHGEPPRGLGHVRAARSEGDGGWQTAGKSKKKNQSVLSQAIHAEQPPRNDGERKGG